MLAEKVRNVHTKIISKESLNDEDYSILVKGIKSGDVATKAVAARALSRLGNPCDLDLIISVLNMDCKNTCLIESAAIYGRLAIEKLKPELSKVKNNNARKYLRYNILRIFRFCIIFRNILYPQIGDIENELKPYFIEYLFDDFKNVRSICIAGLETLQHEDTVSILEKYISFETDAQLKDLAISVLYNIKKT